MDSKKSLVTKNRSGGKDLECSLFLSLEHRNMYFEPCEYEIMAC